MLLAELGALRRAGAFLPGTGSPARAHGEGGPRPRWPEAPGRRWELLWPPDPCRRTRHLSVNAPLQRHRKLREVAGEASRWKQGGWLLRAPGLRPGIHTPQLRLWFFWKPYCLSVQVLGQHVSSPGAFISKSPTELQLKLRSPFLPFLPSSTPLRSFLDPSSALMLHLGPLSSFSSIPSSAPRTKC